MQESSASIGASVLKAVALSLKDCGVPPGRLLAKYQLPMAILDLPDRRVPLKNYLAFIEEAASLSGNSDFGLELSQKAGPEILGAVGFLFFCSPNLLAALNGFIQYVELVQSATRNELTFEGDIARYSYQIADQKITHGRQDAEFSLGLMFRLMKMMVGPACRAVEVHFTHPAPASKRGHERAFGAPVYFEQASNALLIPRAILKMGNNLVDPRLFPVLEGQLNTLLREKKTVVTFGDQVRFALTGHGGLKHLTAKQVAGEIGVSVATLHRRLRQEKLGLRALVDDKLYSIAAHHLKASRLNVTEIAQITGFAESASFTRAFRRWSGVTPSQFRQQP